MGADARDSRIDVAKGALIVLVVLGHFVEGSRGWGNELLSTAWLSGPTGELLSVIYLFHMPAFVLLAGITASLRGRGWRLVQLATLLVVFHTVYTVVLHGSGDPLLRPAYALWFLLSLVVWHAALPLAARWPLPTFAVAVAAALAAGVLPFEPTLLSWHRTLLFWPFFVVGHLWGGRVLHSRPRALSAPGAAVLFVATAALWAAFGPHSGFVRGDHTYADLGLSVAEGIVLRVLVAGTSGVATLLFLWSLPRASRILETVGRRSLSVYLWHIGPILLATPVLSRHLSERDGLTAIVVSLLATAVLVGVLAAAGILDDAVRDIGNLPRRTTAALHRRTSPTAEALTRTATPGNAEGPGPGTGAFVVEPPVGIEPTT